MRSNCLFGICSKMFCILLLFTCKLFATYTSYQQIQIYFFREANVKYLPGYHCSKFYFLWGTLCTQTLPFPYCLVIWRICALSDSRRLKDKMNRLLCFFWLNIFRTNVVIVNYCLRRDNIVSETGHDRAIPHGRPRMQNCVAHLFTE